tara:strand:+ start:2006 stop:2602 length:597 start_codon:yes stop_codon:yes gene_type:complete
MSLKRTGNWKIVIFLDGVNSDGETTYQHIYEHRDGRKAYVGPGYCSDPDLEWILFQRSRENKLLTRKKKREKLSLYIIYAAWLIILTQASIAIISKGAWVLFSLLGYWLTQFGGIGFFNNFRDLVIRSPKFQSEKKLLHFLIIICFIGSGHLLINFGRLHSISILFLQIPVLWFGLFMGMIEALLQKWKDLKFITQKN